MKIIPAYGNRDNLHCLQSCIRSVLEFYLPNKKFTKNYIDKKTLFNDGWSWLPPATVWLNYLGLKVKLNSQFDYKTFAEQGESYIESFKGPIVYQHEKSNGAYRNLKEIQEKTKEMVIKELWINRRLTFDQLRQFLSKDKNLAIGKTVFEWLNGKDILGASHYVLVITNKINEWVVHDPGKPLRANRIIRSTINKRDIFGDILTIEG